VTPGGPELSFHSTQFTWKGYGYGQFCPCISGEFPPAVPSSPWRARMSKFLRSEISLVVVSGKAMPSAETSGIPLSDAWELRIEMIEPC